jgi:peptidylprolyl isomerase
MLKFSFSVCIGAVFLLTASGSLFPAPSDIALGNGIFARITTNRGDIVVSLEYRKAPLTVCNFVALAEGKMNAAGGKPYYNGLTFHRVIADFMIQGGDPLGNGSGGPGYKFPDEIDPSLKHDRPGVLSMANAGPGTNGSQFFITHVATPWLDGKHTVFGMVVEGQRVVNAVRQGDRIERVTIIRNGPDAAAFKADQAAFDALLRNANISLNASSNTKRSAELAQIAAKYPNARISASGIRYIVQKEGKGAKPTAGKIVRISYKAGLLNGRVFDSSDIQGGPQDFPVGVSKILPGMDESLMDMAVGEKRLAIVPPELAYGDKDVGNGLIPANSFIVFEMELLGLR